MRSGLGSIFNLGIILGIGLALTSALASFDNFSAIEDAERDQLNAQSEAREKTQEAKALMREAELKEEENQRLYDLALEGGEQDVYQNCHLACQPQQTRPAQTEEEGGGPPSPNDSPVEKGCSDSDFKEFGYDRGWNDLENRLACVELYHRARGDRSLRKLSKNCQRVLGAAEGALSRCKIIQNIKDARTARWDAEKMDQQAEEARAKVQSLEQEINRLFHACAECRQKRYYESLPQAAKKTTWDRVTDALQFTALMGAGYLQYRTQIAPFESQLDMYRDYLQQCKDIGIPCQSPWNAFYGYNQYGPPYYGTPGGPFGSSPFANNGNYYYNDPLAGRRFGQNLAGNPATGPGYFQGFYNGYNSPYAAAGAQMTTGWGIPALPFETGYYSGVPGSGVAGASYTGAYDPSLSARVMEAQRIAQQQNNMMTANQLMWEAEYRYYNTGAGSPYYNNSAANPAYTGGVNFNFNAGVGVGPSSLFPYGM